LAAKKKYKDSKVEMESKKGEPRLLAAVLLDPASREILLTMLNTPQPHATAPPSVVEEAAQIKAEGTRLVQKAKDYILETLEHLVLFDEPVNPAQVEQPVVGIAAFAPVRRPKESLVTRKAVAEALDLEFYNYIGTRNTTSNFVRPPFVIGAAEREAAVRGAHNEQWQQWWPSMMGKFPLHRR
jgi:hypothetical protein